MSLLTKIKKENENEGSHATKFTRANPQVMMSDEIRRIICRNVTIRLMRHYYDIIRE